MQCLGRSRARPLDVPANSYYYYDLLSGAPCWSGGVPPSEQVGTLTRAAVEGRGAGLECPTTWRVEGCAGASVASRAQRALSSHEREEGKYGA